MLAWIIWLHREFKASPGYLRAFLKTDKQTGKTAQRLIRTFAVLGENWDSLPSTHMMPLASVGIHNHMHVHTHKIKRIKDKIL